MHNNCRIELILDKQDQLKHYMYTVAAVNPPLLGIIYLVHVQIQTQKIADYRPTKLLNR